MDYPQIDIPEALVPPNTIFILNSGRTLSRPLLLPSLEQVESGLGAGILCEEEKSSSKEGGLEVVPETIPTNLPTTKETLSSESVATFNIPFYGEMPIPSPEVIASSVIASGVSATAAVTGSIVLQSVINQLKKLMTKIFKKVLKKEIADQKK